MPATAARMHDRNGSARRVTISQHEAKKLLQMEKRGKQSIFSGKKR